MIEPVEQSTDCAASAVFTTRQGGVSEDSFRGLNLGATSGDRAAAVRANRRLVCQALALDSERVSMGHQVHAATVHVLGAPSRPGRFVGALRGWPVGDGLVTSRIGLALVVLGADCLPILLWHRDGTAVAAAHAGWRGLVGGVIERTVEALGDPARSAAAIGPAIGPARYRVGADVRERFAARFGDEVVAGEAVDLAAAARVALRAAGLPDSSIHAIEACTYDEPDRFYSYRRDGAETGRQAGIIWLGRGAE